ncbi:uncharacterized protein PFL1_00284 [Pseudozyma flocculosa PF-1]|uniref:DNA polymerase eta n=1 Tax=Pseudozyma flocculosa TaxID=84751 RepID=A0A5C3ERR0_9BASI|nr:uncharacterized protein PFL1_00284 [Pseudozyma flocculosa PF-1]EPQ32086.1 hypothetical protein PFL1_00284 [Pseudozyma flocculosa PF-1]SPO34984.1 related to DNA polymerase eta [Pseudozyma flocculosa]
MSSPKKAAQRYPATLSAPGIDAHSPFQNAPSLQAPPEDRPIPSHTNLEVQPHVNGPPPWPVITYKHLLSAGTLNPTNPLRVVAHCDVDAAYAQFEASRLGLDATKVPIAVQQWQGLIAVNYPARDMGISRFESIPEALKKCPDLRLVHVATYAHGSNQADYHENPQPETHKVSLDPYRKESNKILSIFKKTCPSGAVEKASIDESYFDLTIEVRKLMVERFPQLKNVPKDDPAKGIKGMDCPLPPAPRIGLKQWQKLGHVIPKTGEVGKSTGIGRPEKQVAKAALLVDAPVGAGHVGLEGEVNGEAKPAPCSWGSHSEGLTDPISSQPEELDEEEALWDAIEYGETTWTDVALALGAELMNKVRQNVIDELGYTTSAGIASNKTLSKLCSSWRKPNGQTIMRPCSVPNFFSSLPYMKIRFLGGKLGTAIGQEWASSTVADLWSVTLDEMQAKFGEEARWVYNVLRGIDHSEVRERVNNQTMLASKSVRPPIQRADEALHWLQILATELSIRLNEARSERLSLWPKTLVLRYIRAGSVPRSRQVAFPFVNSRSNEELAAVILKKGEKLWRDSVGDALEPSGGGSVEGGKVLTIALGFSGLEEGEAGQRGIAGFLGAVDRSAASTTTAASSSSSSSSTTPRPDASASSSSAATTPTKKRKRLRLDDMFERGRADEKQRMVDLPPPGVTLNGEASTSDAATPKAASSPLEAPATFDRQSSTNEELGAPITPMRGSTSPDPRTAAAAAGQETGAPPSDGAEQPTWQCPECSALLHPPVDAPAFERPYLLERLKEEHQDWHFAVTLSQAPAPPTASQPPARTKPAKPKRPKGLEKFFGKRNA